MKRKDLEKKLRKAGLNVTNEPTKSNSSHFS